MSIKYDPNYRVIDRQVIKHICDMSKFGDLDFKYSKRRFEITTKAKFSEEAVNYFRKSIETDFQDFANILFTVNCNDSVTTAEFEYSMKKDFKLLYYKDKLPPFFRERYVTIIENYKFYSKMLNNYDNFKEASSALITLLSANDLLITNTENFVIYNMLEEYPETIYYIKEMLLLLEFKFIENIVFSE